MMTPETAIQDVWVAWLISWVAASAWSGQTVKRPAAGSELWYRVLTALGAVLLFGLYRPGHLTGRLHVSATVDWAMIALVVVGLLFTWWARIHLGRYWSGTVTRKADHLIVDTGPYALVRHPIYTGILLATVATAIVGGTLLALAGWMLIVLGLYLKARLEERFLREELGAERYDAYARRVPMLVPLPRT